MKVRLFLILFWLFVASLVGAMTQNVIYGDSVLSNDVFVLMGICVVLVLCDEVTKYLNSIKRIKEGLREEIEQEIRNEQARKKLEEKQNQGLV